MTRRRAALLLLASVCFAWPFAAGAASLVVSPLRLSLSPQNARGVINVHNPEASPVLVQAQGFLWTQENGEDRLTAARDLIVVPPVFTLQPGGEQVIRVGFRRPPEAKGELSYRVILSQVPDETDPAEGVTFILRLSLPVFVTPPSAEAKPEWSAEALGQSEVRIKLHNPGSAHLRITKIAILSPSQGEEPLADRATIAYVLAKATREWILPLSRPLSGDSLLLQVETNRGDVEEILPVGR